MCMPVGKDDLIARRFGNSVSYRDLYQQFTVSNYLGMVIFTRFVFTTSTLISLSYFYTT